MGCDKADCFNASDHARHIAGQMRRVGLDTDEGGNISASADSGLRAYQDPSGAFHIGVADASRAEAHFAMERERYATERRMAAERSVWGRMRASGRRVGEAVSDAAASVAEAMTGFKSD